MSCSLTETLEDELTTLRSINGRMRGFLYRCLNDQQYTAIFVTQSIENLTGYATGDFIQNKVRSLASLIDPVDATHVTDEIDTSLSQRKSWTMDYRMLTKDGQSVWVREVGGGVFSTDGELLYTEGLILGVEGERATELNNERRLVSMTQATNAILDDADAILQTIRTLSLLSFNARVEAAHAGESGRGFAVVANEMKLLANNTDTLAKRISASVKTVRAVMNN